MGTDSIVIYPSPGEKQTTMTAKELIEQLSKVAPDTEIVGGTFNGRVETYTVLTQFDGKD